MQELFNFASMTPRSPSKALELDFIILKKLKIGRAGGRAAGGRTDVTVQRALRRDTLAKTITNTALGKVISDANIVFVLCPKDGLIESRCRQLVLMAFENTVKVSKVTAS